MDRVESKDRSVIRHKTMKLARSEGDGLVSALENVPHEVGAEGVRVVPTR